MSDIGGALTTYAIGKVTSVPAAQRDDAMYDARRRPEATNPEQTPATPERAASEGRVDEKTLAGPPPAFKISLLELDERLADDLARVNAERAFGKPEAKPVIDTAPPPEHAEDTEPSETRDDSPHAAKAEAHDSDASTPLMTAQGPAATVETPQSVGETA